MTNRGAIVVLVLLAAGLAAAGAAIWNQHRQTRQALAFWGPTAAHLIDRAATVELFRLDGEGDSAGELSPDTAVDISGARGLVHFRRGLLEDANFEWNDAATARGRTQWDYAVRFSAGAESVVVLFDTDEAWVAGRNAPERAVRVATARGFERFFEENLARRL